MTRRIEDEIVENRRELGRALAADRTPATAQRGGILLSPIPVSVDVQVAVYTRPLGDTLIVGHPDGSAHGWGGELGDQRGAWTQQASVSGSLTRDGQQAIADALVDTDVGLDQASVGDGVVHAFGVDAGAGVTRARSGFRFGESPDPVTDVDIRAADGRVIADAEVSVTADQDTEVRLDVTLTVTDDSRTDNEAVANVDTVAECIRTTDTSLQLDTVALGSHPSQPSTSDTALVSQWFERAAGTDRTGQSAIAATAVLPGEPSNVSYPLTLRELGVFDSAGDLVLRAVVGATDKRERERLRARTGLDIQ